MSIHVRLPAVDGVGFASFARGSPPAMPTLRPETFGLSAPGQGSGLVDAGPPESIEKSMEASNSSHLSSTLFDALRCSAHFLFLPFANYLLSFPNLSKSVSLPHHLPSLSKSFHVLSWKTSRPSHSSLRSQSSARTSLVRTTSRFAIDLSPS